MEEREIRLVDYLNIISKKKWMIIIGTFICMIAAGIVSFILKPVYEIDAIIQPGNFLVENQSGNYEKVLIEDPEQIAGKIRRKSYDKLVATELNVDLKKLPDIQAESIEDTLLARVWIRNHDRELSKEILSFINHYIKEDIDEKIKIEINNIDTEIKGREIEIGSAKEVIKILREKIKIISQRKNDIRSEMESVKNKISQLEEEQLKVLKKENLNEIETLGLLLYSNELQQSLSYLDQLNEKLKNERIAEEDIKSEIQGKSAYITKLESEKENLKERKGRIDYTKIIKKPTSSVDPVFPNKKLNIIIAGILGLIIFTMLSIFMYYLELNKTKNSQI